MCLFIIAYLLVYKVIQLFTIHVQQCCDQDILQADSLFICVVCYLLIGRGGVEMVSEVFQKISPGISNYAHNPGAVAVQLQSLVDVAMEVVPGDLHVVTPLIFKATAGLRLLAPETQNSLLKSVGIMFTRLNLMHVIILYFSNSCV